MIRRLILAGLLGLLAATPAPAQDTVIVIDPDAPPVPLRYTTGPPDSVVQAAVAFHNDSTVSRFYGSFTVASGTTLRGDVAVYRGTLRVIGRIAGRVVVINGNLVLGPLGTLDGDVTVLGGRVQIAPSARHTGQSRTWADPAPVVRLASGQLEIRQRPTTITDLATARARFQAGRLKTTLTLATDGTFNRVEGLAIVGGPTFTLPTPNRSEARFEFLGLLRTAKDQSDVLPVLGYRTGAELESNGRVRGGAGVRFESVVRQIDGLQLSRHELGWSSFLFHRDYDDYYESQGVEGYLYVYPIRTLRAEASIGYDLQGTIPATDPISLLRSDQPWRPNPLVDDGHYTQLRAGLTLDTRNSPLTPTSGWLVRAEYERGVSDDVAPVALPSEVREPLPTFRAYRYDRIGFDARFYARINQNLRANLRTVGGGWLAGDPLPIQRRVALGGPGIMPGLGFRAQNCAPAGLNDPARTALCDRFLAVQGELRVRFPFSFRELLGAQEWLLLQRLFGGDQADVVLFADAGKAWLTGDGPGRVPSNRIPVPKEWDYDVGLGFDMGGLGIFVTKSLSTSESPRLTLRLERRF